MARDNGVPADRSGVAAEDSRGGGGGHMQSQDGGPDLPRAVDGGTAECGGGRT